jgi:hypothetical protein
MVLTRWWQLAIGVVLGAALCMTHARAAFPIAIVFGGLLAWSGLRSNGDDTMTVLAAGFVIGVLGVGLFFLAAIVAGSLFT